MTQFRHIVFMQEPESGSIPDQFLSGEISSSEIVDYLAQWDFGEGEISDTPGNGTSDSTERVGDYLLSWNSRLWYVGLSAIE